MSRSAGGGHAIGGVRLVRPSWAHALLVCGKCLKRHPDGKALRREVKAELKDAGVAKRQRVRVVKTACVGLCPRRAIVVASAATLSDGHVVLVRDPADVAEAVRTLLPRRPSA